MEMHLPVHKQDFPSVKMALFIVGRVDHPFLLFLLTNRRRWMTPLQYVNAEALVLLFRVADAFEFKGSGF